MEPQVEPEVFGLLFLQWQDLSTCFQKTGGKTSVLGPSFPLKLVVEVSWCKTRDSPPSLQARAGIGKKSRGHSVKGQERHGVQRETPLERGEKAEERRSQQEVKEE